MAADAPVITNDAVLPQSTDGTDLTKKNTLASADMQGTEVAVLQRKMNLGVTGHQLPAMQIVGLTEKEADKPTPSTAAEKPESTPLSDHKQNSPAEQPSQATTKSRQTLQELLRRTLPYYFPSSAADDPQKVDDQILQQQTAIEDENKAGTFGPNSREAYQRLLTSLQSQVLPAHLDKLVSLQLPLPPNCPFNLPGTDNGLADDPRSKLEQIAQRKLPIDLGIDQGKAPSQADLKKLTIAYEWIAECNNRVTAAQNTISDKQTSELLEKNTKEKGWPSAWLDEFKKDPEGSRDSAQQMIELAQTTENYSLALADLQRASNGKFPQVLPPGVTRDEHGSLHFDFPKTLEQRDPANQLKIEGLHRWLSDEGAKIDQALRQYKIVDSNPSKILFLGDNELPAKCKALLDKSNNRFVGVVTKADLKGKQGCEALLDKNNQLIEVSSTAEAKEKKGKLENGEHYVDCNVADTNLIYASFKVRTEKDPSTGEDKIIVSQSLQPKKGEWWNYQNIGAANVGKPQTFDGGKDEYKNEKVYKPNDFVPVITSVGMKLVPAKELADFKLNHQIFDFGEKAAVAVMDATMVIQLVDGVGESYFAGRLASWEALAVMTKEAAVAGSGICNSAAGRANRIMDKIGTARGFYFGGHLLLGGGIGAARFLRGQIEATPSGSNIAQNLWRKTVGDRRIVPYVADTYDPLTAPSFNSIFENPPQKIEFNLLGTDHVVPATITRIAKKAESMSPAEAAIKGTSAIAAKVSLAAMAGLSVSMAKGFEEVYERSKDVILGDPLVDASETIGDGQGWQPLLALTMKMDPLAGAKGGDESKGSTGSTGTESSNENSSDPSSKDQNTDNEPNPKIDALNTLELTIGDGDGRRILEETKAKLADKTATREDIEKFKGDLASKLLLDGDTLARTVNFNVAALTEKTIENLNNVDDRTALSPSVQRFLNDKPKLDPETKFAVEAALVALSNLKDGQLQSTSTSQDAKSIGSAQVEVPLRADLDCAKINKIEVVDTERAILDLREHVAKSKAPMETVKDADALLKIGAISELEYGATLEHVLKDPNCSGKDKINLLLGTDTEPFVQVLKDQREREAASANDSAVWQSIRCGQSYGADSRALEQTLRDVAAGDKDIDVRATCLALTSALDSNNDMYIKMVFGMYQRSWQKQPAGAWSEVVMNGFRNVIDFQIQPAPADGNDEQKSKALAVAADTRSVQIRSAKAALSLAGESDSPIRRKALETYASVVGAFDVVDSERVYDLGNTKLALQELNQGALSELAKSDPESASGLVKKTLDMINSPLNASKSDQLADMLSDVSKLVENSDASSREQYVSTLVRLLNHSDVDSPKLRNAVIKNLVVLESTSSIEAIRSHCTALPTITINGKEEPTGEEDASVRQAAIQALVQLRDSSLGVMVADGLLESNESDIAVRSMLRDLRVAKQLDTAQIDHGQIPNQILSEKYKDLDAFSKDTVLLTYFLSGQYSKLLAAEPEKSTSDDSPLRNYSTADEIAAWRKEEEEQWVKLAQLAASNDSDAEGNSMHALDSRSDQAKLVLYEMIQGSISPSHQNKENLADQDWHVQEKAAEALANACQNGAGGRDLSTALIENCLSHSDNLSPQAHSTLLAAWHKLCREKSADGQNVIPAERANRGYGSYKADQQSNSPWAQYVANDMTERLAMSIRVTSGAFQFEPDLGGDHPATAALAQDIKSIESLSAPMRKGIVEKYQQKHHRSLCDDIEARFGKDSDVCKHARALFDAI